VIAGGGKGFLRIFRCVPDLMIDIIPVDYSINLMLAAAWSTAVQKYNLILITKVDELNLQVLKLGPLRLVCITAHPATTIQSLLVR